MMELIYWVVRRIFEDEIQIRTNSVYFTELLFVLLMCRRVGMCALSRDVKCICRCWSQPKSFFEKHLSVANRGCHLNTWNPTLAGVAQWIEC